jgi:hypothetical protein
LESTRHFLEERQGMKTQKVAVWLAVGVGVGVAMGAATQALAIWICIGTIAGAAIGVVLSLLGKATPDGSCPTPRHQ